jgi:ribosome biogenesis GTPase
MLTARVTEAHRTNFTVKTEVEEFTATIRGSFHDSGDFPKVGDYVEITTIDNEQAVIEKVCSRSSVIKRKSGETDEEQIIATNVDVIFIVMGLDRDFNISRLERYLLLAAQSDIKPVIVLNKSDMVDEVGQKTKQVKAISGGVPVLVLSALTGDNMDQLVRFMTPETTAVLLGSSGAGKSTITNFLLQSQTQEVRSIRQDDSRGRHTTTSRQLFSLPSGGYLIDTPGMRELGVIEVETKDENEVFDKIETLAQDCKFRNCDHIKSVGCAVLEAEESGELSSRELTNYHKLLRERQYNENKDSSSQVKHNEQIIKRKNQFESAKNRQRLSRGLK